ncbi:MAG TPA: hypothetical protein P5193_04415, partial [Microthrixaceae bacterium]|nr:hypothetical protein [Microthrixaceae bacterium]
GAEKVFVAQLDAFDQHGHSAPFEALHDFAEGAGACGIHEFHPAHAEDDDVDVGDGIDLRAHAVGAGEEERPLDAEHRDALVARLGELIAAVER